MKTRPYNRFLAASFAGVLITTQASATDLYWDANGNTTTATGGAGIWNTASTWRSGSATGTLGDWANGNVAVFGGTAGTVTLSSSVSVSQLKITNTNYVIGATADSTNTLTFSGTYDDSNRAIDANVNNTTVHAKITGTINGGIVIFHGSNITTPGSSGRLLLGNAANDFIGDVTVLGGNYSASSATMGYSANKLILKGGSLFMSGGAGTVTNVFDRNIDVAADSGISTSVASSGIQTLELSGKITGTKNLTRYAAVTGTSTVKLTGDMSGYSGTIENQLGDILVQTSAASAGKWLVSGGTLTFANTASLYGSNSASWTKENITVNSGTTLVLNAGGTGEFSSSQLGTLFTNLTTGINNNGLRAGAVLRLNVAASTDVSLSNLADSTGTGSGSWLLQKIGSGTLTLSGTNTYTGQTIVQGGSLIFDGGSLDASLTGASSRSLNIGSGGSMEIKNNAQITLGGWVGLGYQSNTGAGTLTLTSGSLTIKGLSGGTPSDRGMVLAEYTGTSGTLQMNGGTLTVDNTMFLGQNGAATWNMAAGEASVSKLNFGANAGSSGILNLTGGTLSVGASGIAKGSGTATLNMGGGTLSSSASWTSSLPMNLSGTNGDFKVATDHTITLSGALTGTGGLVKSGMGTLSLTSASTAVSGTTTVQQGTLALGVDSAIGSTLTLGTSAGGTGILDITAKTAFSQANLSGNGTVNIGAGNTFTVTSNLAPGFSPGTLTVTGNLTVTGTTTMELAGNAGTVGVDSDFVNVSETFTMGGTLNITSYSGYNLDQVATYNLFDAATSSGNFAFVNVGVTPLTLAANVWTGSAGAFTYEFNQGTGALSVIPEPSAVLLGSLGVLALLRRRRRNIPLDSVR